MARDPAAATARLPSVAWEAAKQALKGGATDYVLKDRLQRLPLAVTRAVQEAKEHREYVRTREQLELFASCRAVRVVVPRKFGCQRLM